MHFGKDFKKLGYTIFGTILICVFTMLSANAASVSGAISKSGINKGSVSVSVKEVSTGKIVYALNADKPVSPASTLKILTFSAALDTLGENYEFKTTLYKNKNNDLILKLGADPYLQSSDLKNLIIAAKNQKLMEPKNFNIDDSIIDKKDEWGEGWQWDDDLNPLMPKFSPYNIDKNLLTVTIQPTTKGAPAQITTTEFYPTTFMNLVTTDTSNNVQFTRRNYISPDIITVEGTVNSHFTRNIPINNPRRYFMLRLEDAIRGQKMDYYGKFGEVKLNDLSAYQTVSEVSHSISQAKEDVLKRSNNFIAETTFKLAGGKYAKTTGSRETSYRMLKAYADKLCLNMDDVKIVDGSGVSKNNLVTADFMTDFLVKRAKQSEFESYKNALPTAGEGTLSTRMLYFKNNIHAKTGTLSDISAITGYITTRTGKLYAFDIMINDPKSSDSAKKSLEEYILRAIYED